MNTMQFEFDEVVKHLYKQGRPANDARGCRYRAGKLSFAVGCRIPDGIYLPEMDDPEDECGTSVRDLIIRTGYLLPIEINEYKGMFVSLQYVHDSCAQNGNVRFDFAELEIRLQSVAYEFDLKFTRPEDFK